MRIDANKAVYIAVDYQEKLMPAIKDHERVLANTCFLLKGLKAIGIPMIMTTQYKKGLFENLEEIRRLVGMESSFDKKTFSITGSSEVMDYLKEKDASFVILSGVETHICVLQSVIDLIAMGYKVVLVTDCVGSRFMLDKEMGLRRAEEEGAILTGAESLLYELMVSADHPAFKAVTALVKERGSDEESL